MYVGIIQRFERTQVKFSDWRKAFVGLIIQRLVIEAKLESTCTPRVLIEASMSEPHTCQMASPTIYISICIYNK